MHKNSTVRKEKRRGKEGEKKALRRGTERGKSSDNGTNADARVHTKPEEKSVSVKCSMQST
jgi:hypothetical protein